MELEEVALADSRRETSDANSSHSETKHRKPLGWKAMPFALGNEIFERLSWFGVTTNLTLYLLTKYNLPQVYISVMISSWNGVSNFLTVICAVIADAFLGKYKTIIYGSFATLLGMVMVTLTAIVPQLRPPQCTSEQRIHNQCTLPNRTQLGYLHAAMFWLSLGGGAIRPCGIPFAVDQFDSTTDKGRKGINSFFNWYYTSSTIVLLITSTLVVYGQSVNWAWGFAVPTMCMVFGLVLLFVGSRIYIFVTPDGSVFSSVIKVIVVAYKKRGFIHLPNEAFYDPPPKKTVTKLPLTSKFRFLNKASIIGDNEINQDGLCINPWRLCSVQQVEEVKCLMNIIPIWASAIISFNIPLVQGPIWLVAQALTMDRHIGHNYEIPPSSMSCISLIVVAVILPIYDRYIVPPLEKMTKQEGGFTLLQKLGLGNVFMVLSMVIAGCIERKRRNLAVLHANPDGVAPMSVMWLAPQLVLMGFFDIFNFLGFIEFYNKQFPDKMRSIGNSLVFFTMSLTSYLSSVMVTLVHRWTGRDGQASWLSNDANAGKLDNFYFLIAGLGLLNFIYFLFVARRYRYKASGNAEVVERYLNLEHDSIRL